MKFWERINVSRNFRIYLHYCEKRRATIILWIFLYWEEILGIIIIFPEISRNICTLLKNDGGSHWSWGGGNSCHPVRVKRKRRERERERDGIHNRQRKCAHSFPAFHHDTVRCLHPTVLFFFCLHDLNTKQKGPVSLTLILLWSQTLHSAVFGHASGSLFEQPQVCTIC